MKEIIRHGFLPRRKIKCYWCGCEFTYHLTDLSIGMEDGTENFIVCPECKRILRDKNGEDIQ